MTQDMKHGKLEEDQHVWKMRRSHAHREQRRGMRARWQGQIREAVEAMAALRI